jgi:hypothetical protein
VVEIDRIANSDGTYSARVMVEGIPDANQRPSVKSFTLPTAAA